MLLDFKFWTWTKTQTKSLCSHWSQNILLLVHKKVQVTYLLAVTDENVGIVVLPAADGLPPTKSTRGPRAVELLGLEEKHPTVGLIIL